MNSELHDSFMESYQDDPEDHQSYGFVFFLLNLCAKDSSTASWGIPWLWYS